MPASARYEEGPRRKLERAGKHFEALYDLIEYVRLGADLDSVVVEHDPDAGNWVILGPRLQPISSRFLDALDEMGVVLGDFVHNARGALDLVTFRHAEQHLGRAPTEKEARDIQFPILKSAGHFARAAVLGLVSARVGAEMERMQPYHASDPSKHPLAVLHWLSNRDKHRLVVPSVMANRAGTLRLKVTPPGCRCRWLERDEEAEPSEMIRERIVWRRLEVIPPRRGGSEVHVTVERQPRRAIVFAGPSHHVDIDELARLFTTVQTNVTRLDRLL